MNNITSPMDPRETPPPPSATQLSPAYLLSQLSQFLREYFWWIVGGAAVLKVIAYFIAPQPNATVGYHFGCLLTGFIGYGGILALLAYIVARVRQDKQHVFKTVFAFLFGLACLLDVPTAVIKFNARQQVLKSVEHLQTSYMTFQILIESKETDILRATNINKSGAFENNEPQRNLLLAYEYAVGGIGRTKDVARAVRFCQLAAAAEMKWNRTGNFIFPGSDNDSICLARDILEQSTISWPGHEKHKASRLATGRWQ